MVHGDMGNIKITDAKVAGPGHPSFGVSRAWYTFGVFSRDGSIRRFMTVEAENENAVQMMESLTQRDGSVSATCGLMMVDYRRPQVRSTTVETVVFSDFVIDMVDADRWLNSPYLASLFRKSLSGVERVTVGMKIDERIAEHEWRKSHPLAGSSTPVVLVETPEVESPCDEVKMEQLHSGLIGLGFAKRDVQNFVTSVRARTEPLQDLVMEGIKKLNRGMS